MFSINIDGLDKVGKHTSVLATINQLLKNNKKVLYMDLPQYWFFGNIVSKVLKSENIGVDNRREIEIRCVLYSLDRILSVLYFQECGLNFDDYILVSDRGWTSLTITIGYAIAQGKISEDDVPEFINKISYWDREYIKYFKPKTIFLTVGDDGQSAMDKGIFQREDVFEQPEPQKQSLRLYKQYMNLPVVLTQINGEWRPVNQIVEDVFVKLGLNLELDSSTEINNVDDLFIFGPSKYFPFLYGDEWKVQKEKFGDSLEKLLYYNTINDKNALKEIEKEISETAINNLPNKKYFNIPESIKMWFKTTFSEYEELEKIIAQYSNNEFAAYIKSFGD
ncbi:MAG: hypothetical protein WCJ19_00840 [bacterium]